MIPVEDLEPLLGRYLAGQRWYGSPEAPHSVRVIESQEWLAVEPHLWWLVVEAVDEKGEQARYQVVLGARNADHDWDFLHGKHHEVVGTFAVGGTDVTVYDAVVDAELALALLAHVAPGVESKSVRALTVEQSNTSVVYDEAIILKLFRQLGDGPNPDVDVVTRLTELGFDHVPAQVGVLRREGLDLAVARQFLRGAVDGWHLALVSLRDLYGSRIDPADCGGDFAPESRRLGRITAELHLALAEAYGTSEPQLDLWVADARTQLGRVHGPFAGDQVAARYDALASLGATGVAIRIHGDLHLGQTLRDDAGWYVIDFEGEPARPVEERIRPSSPLRDVAGMLRSFHYAAEISRIERAVDDPDLERFGQMWEDRARTHFLEGYLAVEGIDALLPDEPQRSDVLRFFELDKAVYEVGYEVAHRPDWAAIPAGAIDRLLAEA